MRRLREASSGLVLIDTSAWICFFARKGFEGLKQSVAHLLDQNRAATTGPILVEIIQGCRTAAEKHKLKGVMKGVHWITITDDMWETAADISFDLRRKEVTISVVDAIIATVAISTGSQLLHHDSDYALIARHTDLAILNYECFKG
jgi:predicted nucleic acid-binding protein